MTTPPKKDAPRLLPPTPGFLDLLNLFEETLAGFYGFTPAVQAADFLVDSAADSSQRAQVLVEQPTDSDEAFVGICFSGDIIKTIDAGTAGGLLTESLLDAWFVLIEELSHFHLIVNRAERGQSTRLVELEFQAEIDKVLITGQFLEQRLGMPPHHQSLLKLVREGKITAAAAHYEFASRMAAKAMARMNLSQSRPLTAQARDALRKLYYLDFAGKLDQLGLAA